MDGSLQSKITLFLLFFCLLGCSHKRQQKQEPYLLSLRDKALIKEGDIILRMGEGWLSQFICKQLNDTIHISHCGILVRSNTGGFDVIHVLSKEVSDTNGVQRCSLDQFTADSQRGTIQIVRLKKDSTHILTEKAIYYLNKKIPFDHTFNLQDSTAFFCSELPLHILKYHIGIDLYPSPPNTPRFSIFLDKRYFIDIL